MKILIAGDFYIADQHYNKQLIDKSVDNLFKQADYRIVNLEAPFTDGSSRNKIIKTGPHLRMSEKTVISYLQHLNIDGVTLANNHILDYGAQGLLDTLNSLIRNNISYVGAGENLKYASKYQTLEQNGVKIAILNFCENEWSIAESDKPGANPMDIIENANQIKRAKEKNDKVICIVHGGHEYYNLPSPRMQKQYRFYAEQGADIVVGHHTHCISGNEVYKGVPIYYSLGNFLFKINNNNDEWYTGLILEIDLLNEEIKHQIHPVRQCKISFNLSLLTGNEKKQVLERVTSFSAIIQDEKKLNQEWDKYIKKQNNIYLNYWSPISFIQSRFVGSLLRKIGGKMINRKGLSLYLNLMRCEAHSDLSKESLKRYLKK